VKEPSHQQADPAALRLRVEWLDRVESTNSALRDRLAHDPELPAGLILAAREQTAGRGRGGRSWSAPPGRSLAFSVLLRPAVPTPQLLSLPMAAALATSDVLREHHLVPTLKWPNDVRVGERKISGVLLETVGAVAILGVGLNVNMTPDEAAAVDQPATSLRIETGSEHALEPLLEAWCRAFVARYGAWHAHGFGGLLADWEARAQAVGTVTTRGRVAGYGAEGQLLVERNGTVDEVWDAEIRG
jgi:BirA family biotin operon repressor/biotin-[acetyl-CoA-carboxylase] ligase